MKQEEFITEANEYGERIWGIIRNRREHPLTFIQQVNKRPEDYVKCQRHHIIPRCWYRKNHLDVDNGPENVINLTPGEHLEIHVLMREYFKTIGDKDMYYRMALAIDKLVSGNEKWIDALVSNSDEKAQYIKEYEDNLEIMAEAVAYRVKHMAEEERKELGRKISDGWDNMPDEKYERLRKDRAVKKKANWQDAKSKMGSDEWRKNQSIAQKQTWDSKSDAEKILHGQRISAAWNSKTDEEQEELRRKNAEAQKKHWANATEADRKKLGNSIRAAMKKKTPEEMKLWRQHQAEAIRRYHENKRKAKEALQN